MYDFSEKLSYFSIQFNIQNVPEANEFKKSFVRIMKFSQKGVWKITENMFFVSFIVMSQNFNNCSYWLICFNIDWSFEYIKSHTIKISSTLVILYFRVFSYINCQDIFCCHKNLFIVLSFFRKFNLYIICTSLW